MIDNKRKKELNKKEDKQIGENLDKYEED